jgi:hypothetical protein
MERDVRIGDGRLFEIVIDAAAARWYFASSSIVTRVP